MFGCTMKTTYMNLVIFNCFSSLFARLEISKMTFLKHLNFTLRQYITSLKKRLLHTKVLQSLSPLAPSCEVPKVPPCASFQNLKCTGPQLWGSKNSEKYDKIQNFSWGLKYWRDFFFVYFGWFWSIISQSTLQKSMVNATLWNL
jgi:hypothetical protein